MKTTPLDREFFELNKMERVVEKSFKTILDMISVKRNRVCRKRAELRYGLKVGDVVIINYSVRTTFKVLQRKAIVVEFLYGTNPVVVWIAKDGSRGKRHVLNNPGEVGKKVGREKV